MPHAVQTVPPLPSISCDTDTRVSTPSDEVARQVLDAWFMDSDRLCQHKMEPVVDDPGVPTS